jgi:hypothetical protein
MTLRRTLLTFVAGYTLGALLTGYLVLGQGEAIGVGLVAAGVRLANAAQMPVFSVSAGTALQVPPPPLPVRRVSR